MNLHIDLESAPQRMDDFEPSAPAQYKKPESIKAYIDEHYDELLQEEVKKRSLNALQGRIVSMAWGNAESGVFSFCGDDEREVITAFFGNTLVPELMRQPTIIGHNIAGFDLPYIRKRCQILGIKPPHWFPVSFKPWDTFVYDTMLQWDSKNFVSQDNLAEAFGVREKIDFTAQNVYQAFLDGDYRAIRDYNEKDVRENIEIYKRMTFASC